MEIPFKVNKPSVPDCIRVIVKEQYRKPNKIYSPELIPIEKLSGEEALEFAELLRTTFIEKWERETGKTINADYNSNSVMKLIPGLDE